MSKIIISMPVENIFTQHLVIRDEFMEEVLELILFESAILTDTLVPRVKEVVKLSIEVNPNKVDELSAVQGAILVLIEYVVNSITSVLDDAVFHEMEQMHHIFGTNIIAQTEEVKELIKGSWEEVCRLSD